MRIFFSMVEPSHKFLISFFLQAYGFWSWEVNHIGLEFILQSCLEILLLLWEIGRFSFFSSFVVLVKEVIWISPY